MRRLTILVTPIDCVGHVNACAGSTAPLLKRGHRVIFVVEKAFKGKLATLGFEEDTYELQTDGVGNNAGETWANDLFTKGVIGPYPLEAKYEALLTVFHYTPRAIEVVKQSNLFIENAIKKYQPDLIWFDAAYIWPSIYYSGIPWVLNMSLTPVIYISCDTDEVPPNGSGFPSNSPKDEKWQRFKKLNRLFKHNKLFNDYLEQNGYPRFTNDVVLPINESLLTLYAFPEEYNYPVIQKTNWFNLEVFNKFTINDKVCLSEILPGNFFSNTLKGKWSGKWVYLSLGSMGSIDLNLMNRILETIADTNHKYIVSKGPRHQEINLPNNAWGDRFLPQMKLVPHMDLVITHGGNNTITEVFALAVPMIVFPLFGDQYDNAQRLHETGYGCRLDPYEFKKEQLVEKINQLMANEEVKAKLKKASNRIMMSNKHEILAKKVEQLMAQKLLDTFE